MDDVRWLTEREERAWWGLQFMQMRLEHELAQQLAVESGLSYPDYHVLVTLTDQPTGQMRLFELGDTLGWEKSRRKSIQPAPSLEKVETGTAHFKI